MSERRVQIQAGTGDAGSLTGGMAKATYGIDAPRQVRKLATRGGGLILIAAVMMLTNKGTPNPLIAIAFSIGIGFLVGAAAMVWSSLSAKPKLLASLVESLDLRGTEQVLDVGCGRGMLLILVAKRLTSGKATGLDIWRDEDQSGNSAEATLANARAEGVAGKIQIENADARQMPFAASRFDVVVSSLAIHNISSAEGRTAAISEIVRVLKPDSRLMILDIFRTADYAKELERLGMADVVLSGTKLLWLVPTRHLTARKP